MRNNAKKLLALLLMLSFVFGSAAISAMPADETAPDAITAYGPVENSNTSESPESVDFEAIETMPSEQPNIATLNETESASIHYELVVEFRITQRILGIVFNHFGTNNNNHYEWRMDVQNASDGALRITPGRYNNSGTWNAIGANITVPADLLAGTATHGNNGAMTEFQTLKLDITSERVTTYVNGNPVDEREITTPTLREDGGRIGFRTAGSENGLVRSVQYTNFTDPEKPRVIFDFSLNRPGAPNPFTAGSINTTGNLNVPANAVALSTNPPVVVTSFSELKTAIETPPPGPGPVYGPIVIEANNALNRIEFTEAIEINRAVKISTGSVSTQSSLWMNQAEIDDPLVNTRHFIVNQGGHLTLEHVILQGSAQMPSRGGILVNHNGRLSVSNSLFLQNGTTVAPGGGAVRINGGVATISHSEFQENFATTGGAIYVGNFGQLIVEETKFIHNNATVVTGIVRDHDDTAVWFGENVSFVPPGTLGDGLDSWDNSDQIRPENYLSNKPIDIEIGSAAPTFSWQNLNFLSLIEPGIRVSHGSCTTANFHNVKVFYTDDGTDPEVIAIGGFAASGNSSTKELLGYKFPGSGGQLSSEWRITDHAFGRVYRVVVTSLSGQNRSAIGSYNHVPANIDQREYPSGAWQTGYLTHLKLIVQAGASIHYEMGLVPVTNGTVTNAVITQRFLNRRAQALNITPIQEYHSWKGERNK